MVELLSYLRANGFKCYIVTGAGVDFVRAYAGKAYGIAPEHVIGSSLKTRFELNGDVAELIKLPSVESNDDGPNKPININLAIGKRPILAFGNSDGDQQMLEYAASGKGARLMLLLHHDDAEREYAYDRQSKIGYLDKALDEAVRRDWVVVSMKKDFKTIFPLQAVVRFGRSSGAALNHAAFRRVKRARLRALPRLERDEEKRKRFCGAIEFTQIAWT